MFLADIPFADLAIDIDPAGSRYKESGDNPELREFPDASLKEIGALRAEMLDHKAGRFRMDWMGKILLRVQRRETPLGPVFVARRIDAQLRSFDKIGLPTGLQKRLRAPGLRGGLVLFCGSPGSGKTTAACSLMIERLQSIGGFAWTAENPAEYSLQGAHGKGQCYQQEIDDDREVMSVLMDTLRSSADMFYIGEIREEQAARAGCIAANSGMLVIATLHADNIAQAIGKLALLAEREQIASSLKWVISLRLEHKLSAIAGMERVLRCESLQVDDEPTRSKIRDGNAAALNMDIERQRTLMLVAA